MEVSMRRTIYCGELRKEHIDQSVTVMGWVQSKRDMGGIIFIDLRDKAGILQIVFDASNLSEDEFKSAESLRNETVVAVEGLIRHRDEETYNPKLSTGVVELKATRLEILSEAQTLPFAIEDDTNVREDLRLKYRFLDIRRPSLANNLRFRHAVLKSARDYLDRDGFTEVETPMLTKSTPEGARDYLVPSRVHPGTFYALPQSPQIFKQLLMVGGMDKYYQVARCFRDEDLRADRQPEFTQVDMELSFVEQEDILIHLEKLFKHIFKETMGIAIEKPFPRLTWQQSMDMYGCDKPDLRFDFPIIELSEIAKTCSFEVFRKVVDAGGAVRALNIKGCADFTRSTIEDLTKKAFEYGAKGMAWIAIREDGELYSVLTKFFKPEELDAIIKKVDGKPGDFIIFCADKIPVICKTLGGLRTDIADMLNLRDKTDYKFVIVTDFPEFEYSEEEGRFMAMHHPFTMPYEEDVPYLISDPGRVRAQAYDFVLNGIELGSGSIRIHKKEMQETMFEALGFSKDVVENRFGFMVNAFSYGTPPHGGFAFGLDRLVMLMVGAESLREVVAFPKVRDASCLMTNAPDVVEYEQLDILNISIKGSSEETAPKAIKKKIAPKIDVDNVANLARLILSDEEKLQMQEDLGAIITFADQLNSIDTGDIGVTAHIVPINNVFREDKIIPSFGREELLLNTPTWEDGFIYVPKVVE
jgi:aspartyl-tRNA synthetase